MIGLFRNVLVLGAGDYTVNARPGGDFDGRWKSGAPMGFVTLFDERTQEPVRATVAEGIDLGKLPGEGVRVDVELDVWEDWKVGRDGSRRPVTKRRCLAIGEAGKELVRPRPVQAAA